MLRSNAVAYVNPCSSSWMKSDIFGIGSGFCLIFLHEAGESPKLRYVDTTLFWLSNVIPPPPYGTRVGLFVLSMVVDIKVGFVYFAKMIEALAPVSSSTQSTRLIPFAHVISAITHHFRYGIMIDFG